MSWLNASAAWFLLLIPAVIILYFLRLRRNEVVISSSLLWSRALEDRRANAPFQKLRNSLLMFLQILAIAMMVLALARPETEVTDVPGLTHILLVDVSASMATDEGGRPRLDLCKEAAKNYIGGIGKREQGIVVRFARDAKALTSVSSDRTLLERAIDSLEIEETSTSVDAAMELAVSLAAAQTDAKGVIFSDGGFLEWQGGEVPLPVEYVGVGTPQPNSGIVALSARPDLNGRPQVFVEIRNFSKELCGGSIDILQNQELIRADQSEIAAGEKWTGSFTVQDAGLIEVVWRPDTPDALLLDNRAWMGLLERRDLSVWRVGGSNYFLDEALSSQPRMVIESVAAEDVESLLAESPPDVILWDRVAPDTVPTHVAGQLFFGALPPGVWEQAEEVSLPEIITWDRTHPVNRFLSYADIEAIEKSYVMPATPGSHVVVDTRGGGIISTFTLPGTRGLVVGFDLLASDWPLRLSFPLFVHNALRYLAQGDGSWTTGVQAGELIQYKALPGVEEVEVTRPDESRQRQGVDSDEHVRYADTAQVGPYRFTDVKDGKLVPESTRIIPANLTSHLESDLTPKEKVAISGREVATSSKETRTERREYWPWLLLLGLITILGEWYCYHHR